MGHAVNLIDIAANRDARWRQGRFGQGCDGALDGPAARGAVKVPATKKLAAWLSPVATFPPATCPFRTGNVDSPESGGWLLFRKAGGGVSGINLYRHGKGDKSPVKVGFYFRTPAIDTSPGKGELIYTARAVLNGEELGQPSDAVNVTIS